MEKKLNIYISLPITGRDINAARAEAAAVAMAIEAAGHTPVSPFDVCPEALGLTYNECIGRDITALLACDAICLASEACADSRGCSLEAACAVIYGKAIYEYDPDSKTITPMDGWDIDFDNDN